MTKFSYIKRHHHKFVFIADFASKIRTLESTNDGSAIYMAPTFFLEFLENLKT